MAFVDSLVAQLLRCQVDLWEIQARLQAEEQAVRARKEQEAAEELRRQADEVDPDVDVDADESDAVWLSVMRAPCGERPVLSTTSGTPCRLGRNTRSQLA